VGGDIFSFSCTQSYYFEDLLVFSFAIFSSFLKLLVPTLKQKQNIDFTIENTRCVTLLASIKCMCGRTSEIANAAIARKMATYSDKRQDIDKL